MPVLWELQKLISRSRENYFTVSVVVSGQVYTKLFEPLTEWLMMVRVKTPPMFK
jgi:hypothetical protein